MTHPQLPAPITAYYAAKNRHDIDAMLLPFAEDAHVHDEGEDHVGYAAIRAWMDRTTRKYRVTVEPLEAGERDGWLEVIARVSGDFPGSPANLRYRFQLDGDRITALTIGS